jgi:hypothetical protein
VRDNPDLENRGHNGEQDQSGAPSSTEAQTDFAKGALAHATEKNKMEQIDVPIEVYGLRRYPSNERTRRPTRERPTSGRQQTPPMTVWNYNKASSRMLEAKGRRIAARLPKGDFEGIKVHCFCTTHGSLQQARQRDRQREFLMVVGQNTTPYPTYVSTISTSLAWQPTARSKGLRPQYAICYFGSGHRSINGREDHEGRIIVLFSMPYTAAHLTLESQWFNIDAANRLNNYRNLSRTHKVQVLHAHSPSASGTAVLSFRRPINEILGFIFCNDSVIEEVGK